MSAPLALVVNPMSGRDVRRLAARATNMTHEAKRDIVARIAAGADAMGVTDIYVAREPFRIASMALELMPLDARVHVLDLPLTNSARDTEQQIRAFRAEGCDTFVSLGGDGTNRAIVRALEADAEVTLIPLSTGTNNVFPELVEPTVAGMVAGMQARHVLPDRRFAHRVKVLRIHDPEGQECDVGLIDAVLLANDHVGNMLPFDPGRLRRLVLTRAEPDAIGMSPIGGYLDPVYGEDDAALEVSIGDGPPLCVPLSPGLFRKVCVSDVQRVPLDGDVAFTGPGVLALDGDRDHKLVAGARWRVRVARDGPWRLDVSAVMRWAAAQGVIARGPGVS